MKTKILTLFLLLLIGVGTSFAQVNEDFILESLEERGISVENWLSTPGTGEEKLSALLLEGTWILLEDSTRLEGTINLIGTRCVDHFKIKRMIRYSSKTGFESKTKAVHQGREGAFFNLMCGVIITFMAILCLIRGYEGSFRCGFCWLSVSLIFGAITYFCNVYLGALVGVLAISVLISGIVRRITL